MPNEEKSPAARFIEDAVNHPEWLKVIEAGQADAVVKLAADNGYSCTLDELKAAAKTTIAGSAGKAEPSRKDVEEAAAGMSDLENDTGYGGDTGYAALYGVAGMILKM